MTQTEALKALVHEMEYVLSCINEDKIPFDGDDFHEALRLGKEALAQPDQYAKGYADAMNWKTANHLEHLPAQPEQEPVAWEQFYPDIGKPQLKQPKVRTGDCLLVGVCASEGHKIAPQRTWVNLTAEEIEIIMNIEMQILEHLKYTPEDGKVWWVKHPRRSTANGTEAGNMMQNGYRKLKFFGKQYLTHRMAWFLHHGRWPAGDIDHIDGKPSNNKLSNLRDVTHCVNIQNRKSATVKNKTGFLGVVKRKNKFAAHVHRNGKQIYLGLFETAELAHQAYKENT